MFQITKNDEKRKCVDCLHCKVSAASTRNWRVCFCSEQKVKTYDSEFFWLSKSVCRKFEDMTA